MAAAAAASVIRTPAALANTGAMSMPSGKPASDASQSQADTREIASRGTFRWKTVNQLATIDHDPSLSIDELRHALGLTHSGAVRLVDRLEDDGLVQRSRGSGRVVGLGLTGRGRRVLARIERARLTAAAELVSPLDAGEQPQLELFLRRILAAQTAGDEDLHRICRLCSFDACESGGRKCPVALAARAMRPGRKGP